MNMIIQPIPTNIVTGFLGVGKTTAILNLLKNKPTNERWAVLVNEFGEIGVDGSIFNGQHSAKQGVFVAEVPGGCMCCTSGLPMQIALNQLLMRAKPDRLLIEPTGLGHPKEVLQLLSSKYYREVLSIQKTVTLVDARNLKEERYTTHSIFNQQIEMADIVVGNKMDLYQQHDKENLVSYVARHAQPYTKIVFSQQGEIGFLPLEGKSAFRCRETEVQPTVRGELSSFHSSTIPSCGFLKASNQGEGFYSTGWRFEPELVFEHRKLIHFLSGVRAERLKAVMITDQGVFGYNLTQDALTEVVINDCMESCIEVISDEPSHTFEESLMDCLLVDTVKN
jgi:G3E family GTPase